MMTWCYCKDSLSGFDEKMPLHTSHTITGQNALSHKTNTNVEGSAELIESIRESRDILRTH